MSDNQKVRVYAVYGFLGDQLQAPINEIVYSGAEDCFLVADFLSEDTYQILKKLGSDHFYARFLENMLSVQVLRAMYARRIRLVCNAGALNPKDCAEALKAKLDLVGIPLKVAYIDGDNLADAMETFGYFPNSKDQQPLSADSLDKVISSTVYIGSEHIANAFRQGADIVVAGRVTDCGMTLGALMSQLPWQYHRDWDKMAAGAIAGHLLSCGGQSARPVSPGYLSPREIAQLSYPGVDVSADGTVHLVCANKISPESALSQIFYGISSTRYIDPDVIIDLSGMEVAQVDDYTVAVSGIKGLPEPEKLRAMVLLKGDKHTMTGIFQIPRVHEETYGDEGIRELIRLRIAAGGVHLPQENLQTERLGVSNTDVFYQVHAIFKTRLYAALAKAQVPSLIVSGMNGSYGNVPHLEDEVLIWDSLVDRSLVESRLALTML